ncbi:MAG: UbiA family prenyltransferase [Thermomicrobiales bacterium]
MATWPFSFTASIVPVLIGTLLAAYEGDFDVAMFVLVIVASVLVHAGSNLVNDHYDHQQCRRGQHQLGRGGNTIQRGWIAPRAISFGLVLFGLATVIGFSIVYLVGWPVRCSSPYRASRAAYYFYTGGPKPLGYVALGEAIVFIFMGPVIVTGSYYVQTGAVSWLAVRISLPIVGLLVTAILRPTTSAILRMMPPPTSGTSPPSSANCWAVRGVCHPPARLLRRTRAHYDWRGILPGTLLVFLTLPKKAIELVRVVRTGTLAAALNLLVLARPPASTPPVRRAVSPPSCSSRRCSPRSKRVSAS